MVCINRSKAGSSKPLSFINLRMGFRTKAFRVQFSMDLPTSASTGVEFTSSHALSKGCLSLILPRTSGSLSHSLTKHPNSYFPTRSREDPLGEDLGDTPDPLLAEAFCLDFPECLLVGGVERGMAWMNQLFGSCSFPMTGPKHCRRTASSCDACDAWDIMEASANKRDELDFKTLGDMQYNHSASFILGSAWHTCGFRRLSTELPAFPFYQFVSIYCFKFMVGIIRI